MTRLFFTGLEAGSLDIFGRAEGGIVISATKARTGAHSLRTIHAGHLVGQSLGTPGYSELFVRTGLYMTGGLGYDRTFCTLVDTAFGSSLLTFQVRLSDNVVLVRRGDHNDTIIASGGSVPLNTWCCIEFHALISNTVGIVQIKVNGKLRIDFSGDTQPGTIDTVGGVIWGCSPTSENFVCYGYYDDLAINDPAGTRNNTWVGQGGTIGLVPVGAGHYTQLTPSAGANWAALDEVPPDDDVLYVEGATINLKDTYMLGDLSVTPDYEAAITAIQWLCRAKNTAAQAGGFARLLRIGGIDFQGSSLGYDVEYDYRSEIMEISPVTGLAWAEGEVNALEAGIVVR